MCIHLEWVRRDMLELRANLLNTDFWWYFCVLASKILGILLFHSWLIHYHTNKSFGWTNYWITSKNLPFISLASHQPTQIPNQLSKQHVELHYEWSGRGCCLWGKWKETVGSDKLIDDTVALLSDIQSRWHLIDSLFTKHLNWRPAKSCRLDKNCSSTFGWSIIRQCSCVQWSLHQTCLMCHCLCNKQH